LIRAMMLTFPTGRVGAALLLLRVYVAALAVPWIVRYGAAQLWPCAAIGILGAFVLFGFFTRAAAAALCLAGVALVLQGNLAAQCVAQGLILAALVLAGPGAFSADAWIFGRQVIRIRP
jgi:putative oxidoreductase